MTIDKPSLAVMLAQSKRDEVLGKDEGKVSTRPFILKDPKAIVKDMLKKEAKPQPEESDEDYIKSLMTREEEPSEEPVEFQLDLPLEDEPVTADTILKRIMGKK